MRAFINRFIAQLRGKSAQQKVASVVSSIESTAKKLEEAISHIYTEVSHNEVAKKALDDRTSALLDDASKAHRVATKLREFSK